MANKYRLKFSLSNGETIDAGEIIVPEGAKGDKGDKGDPYTLTSTDKAAIVQDVLAALPYYDGSVNISGGVELISFTIDGDHYEAEEGMTWAEWVDSEYNTDGYVKSADVISNGDGMFVKLNGNSIFGSDVIVEGASYELMRSGGSVD